ncbi:transglutaminase domain-containing protein [Rhodosalinus sediminis]|uniref:Transglutaminase domain-containing protein n=2 Tax=Rhodosalinus sediminis TaxID=1940533 RepID=A0A3D9BS30_9RHOB|nr:transglutaminase domain-containing protein [Rhodosalinus sediminis]
MQMTYSARVPEGAEAVLIPGGLVTPHGRWAPVATPGMDAIEEATTGQRAYRLAPEGDEIAVTFRFDPSCGAYPDAIFTPHPSRFTRYADDLVAEVDDIAGDRAGLERARAVANHVAARFTYGHPEARFNDGFEVVPALGCGLVEGSCVDINTYFIAALRAAGIEAGYVTGFFFPEEKGGTCEDGHCWVVTRIDGASAEWDIAHHLKLGRRDIHPGLNPKPGRRLACFHSMGLAFPDLGISEMTALIEPVAVLGGEVIPFEAPRIRLAFSGIR